MECRPDIPNEYKGRNVRRKLNENKYDKEAVGKLDGVLVEGQTEDKRQESPKPSYNLFDRLVGHSNETSITINGIETCKYIYNILFLCHAFMKSIELIEYLILCIRQCNSRYRSFVLDPTKNPLRDN